MQTTAPRSGLRISQVPWDLCDCCPVETSMLPIHPQPNEGLSDMHYNKWVGLHLQVPAK